MGYNAHFMAVNKSRKLPTLPVYSSFKTQGIHSRGQQIKGRKSSKCERVIVCQLEVYESGTFSFKKGI